jgi:hypothetical protein
MATSTGRDGGIPGTAGPAGTAANKESKVPCLCLRSSARCCL